MINYQHLITLNRIKTAMEERQVTELAKEIAKELHELQRRAEEEENEVESIEEMRK